ELLGVLGFAVHLDLVMDVGARAATAAAEKADLGVFGDPLARRDDVTVKVSVNRRYSVPVIDFDDLAVLASVPCIGHDPCCRRVNQRHVGSGQIETRVKRPPVIERIVTRAKSALELILIEGYGQRQRFDEAAHRLQLVLTKALSLTSLRRGYEGTAFRAVGTELREQPAYIEARRGQ